MSRIGNKIITLPKEVTATIDGKHIVVSGPKGSLEFTIHRDMEVQLDGSELVVVRPTDSKQHKALHGTTRALINNMAIGVSEGYTKKLQMIGVGYRALLQGDKLIISAGFSHPVELDIPAGLTVEVPKNTVINVSGIDKQLVGEFAANVRGVRPPEPYLGKGIRYATENVRRKEGKTAKK